MSTENEIRHEAPTRRETVRKTGAIVGTGLLSGCISDRGGGTRERGVQTEG